jgi:hypothetical protein
MTAGEREESGHTLLSKTTLKHIKFFLSGVFVHAKILGVYNGINPVTAIRIPNGRRAKEIRPYSVEEVEQMLRILF